MLGVWTTERLLLRQLPARYAPAVADYGVRSAEYHRPWDPIRPAEWWEPQVVAARLDAEIADADAGRSLAVYLSPREEPDLIVGRIALANIVRGAYWGCHVGYGLAPDAAGRGLMTEALDEAVRIAFEELRLHRVEANVIPENVRSLALVRRCGFAEEGLSPRYLKIAGRWRDHMRFARINDALETAEVAR